MDSVVERVLSIVLNLDLRHFALPCLPAGIATAKLEMLEGPLFLQLVSWSDVSRGRDEQAGDRASHTFKLELTDGTTTVSALEMASIADFRASTFSIGMKLVVRHVQVRHGMMCLKPLCVLVLGGIVSATTSPEFGVSAPTASHSATETSSGSHNVAAPRSVPAAPCLLQNEGVTTSSSSSRGAAAHYIPPGAGGATSSSTQPAPLPPQGRSLPTRGVDIDLTSDDDDDAELLRGEAGEMEEEESWGMMVDDEGFHHRDSPHSSLGQRVPDSDVAFDGQVAGIEFDICSDTEAMPNAGAGVGRQPDSVPRSPVLPNYDTVPADYDDFASETRRSAVELVSPFCDAENTVPADNDTGMHADATVPADAGDDGGAVTDDDEVYRGTAPTGPPLMPLESYASWSGPTRCYVSVLVVALLPCICVGPFLLFGASRITPVADPPTLIHVRTLYQHGVFVSFEYACLPVCFSLQIDGVTSLDWETDSPEHRVVMIDVKAGDAGVCCRVSPDWIMRQAGCSLAEIVSLLLSTVKLDRKPAAKFVQRMESSLLAFSGILLCQPHVGGHQLVALDVLDFEEFEPLTPI